MAGQLLLRLEVNVVLINWEGMKHGVGTWQDKSWWNWNQEEIFVQLSLTCFQENDFTLRQVTGVATLDSGAAFNCFIHTHTQVSLSLVSKHRSQTVAKTQQVLKCLL